MIVRREFVCKVRRGALCGRLSQADTYIWSGASFGSIYELNPTRHEFERDWPTWSEFIDYFQLNSQHN